MDNYYNKGPISGEILLPSKK